MTPQNTPLEISDEATTTVAKIGSLCYSPDLPHRFHDNAEKLVQLAINSATAELREENEKLKKILCADSAFTCLNHTDSERNSVGCPVCTKNERNQLKLRVEELERDNTRLNDAMNKFSNDEILCLHVTQAQEIDSLQKQIVGLRDAFSKVVDERPEADILCDDGFTMSFHKNSPLHKELINTLSESTNFSHLYVRREVLEKLITAYGMCQQAKCEDEIFVRCEDFKKALTLARKELGE